MAKLKQVKVFFASPSDLDQERAIFSEIIEALNRSRTHKEGFHLEPITWGKYAYPDTQNPQIIINKLFEDADLIIVAFWNKFGAPTDSFPSGTMEEFSLAYDRKKNTGTPSIKLYFREPTPPRTSEEIEELKKIIEFKESVSNIALYKEYSDLDKFKSLLQEHINAWFSDYISQPKKASDQLHPKRTYSNPSACRNLVEDVFIKMESKYDGLIAGETAKLSFGIQRLDELIGAIEDLNLLILAGDESSGKTALILTLINNISTTNKVPTLYFAMRDDKQSATLRLLSNKAKVDARNIAQGFLGKADWHKITSAAGALSEAPLFIDDNSVLPFNELREIISSFKRLHNIQLVVIDGLNYITGNKESLGQELVLMSKSLNVPIISSVRIETPTRFDKHPEKEDLNKFNDIYAEADIIVFLYRKGLYEPVEIDNDIVEAIVAKHRASFTGRVNLLFSPQVTGIAGTLDYDF